MRSAIKNYLGMISIAVIAVLVIGAIGVRIDRDQTPETPTPIDATPAITGNSPDMLVDARWLDQYQNHVDYIFDLSDLRQYNEGHIPGAHHVYVQDAMRLHTANFGEADQISIGDNQDVFGHLNLNVPQNARIILYDTNNSERATWLLWVMKINGYTDVHVLDGGAAAWLGNGGELTTEAPAAIETNAVATPTWDESVQIRREPLLEQLENPDIVIIDSRSAEEQKDTVNGTIREGHIPGAINIPTAEVMREDGTFKSTEELQELFASYGVDPDDQVVVYSLFTTKSGNLWLALHLAGYENVVIYQEGFVAWAYNDELPISTDPFPTAEAVEPTGQVTPATPQSTPQSTPVSELDTPFGTPDDGPTDLTGEPNSPVSTPAP